MQELRKYDPSNFKDLKKGKYDATAEKFVDMVKPFLPLSMMYKIGE